ncbi:MAG: acylphosphatase [Verrucomicrobia bacterium]|nr:acylphosphatase [Verrucomicrobiota bacterium]
MLEMRVIFHGNVQGVGFRAAVKRIAEEDGLTGFVRNLRDGSVETVVQGEKNVLEAFLQQAHEAFDIDDYQETYKKISKPYTKFQIVS